MKWCPRISNHCYSFPMVMSIFLSCVFLLNVSVKSYGADVKKMFILHSYEQEHVCGQPQHDGVVASLKNKGFKVGENLSVATYYMDTKRNNNTTELIARQADIALQKITDFSPDVLVTIDDNAYRTVAIKLVDRPLSIVFSGMNAQPEDYNTIARAIDSWNLPGHNVTGVYEKLHFLEALQVHAKLFTSLQKVVAFVDTSPTGKAIKKQIELEIAGEQLPCKLDIKVIQSFEQYKKEILKASVDPKVGAIYPAALLLRDGQGNTYTAPDIFAWTIKNSRKPEIALNYSFTRIGLFGGAAVDFYAMGEQAGEMIAEIFQGKNAGTLPIKKAERYALAFNLVRAESLNIQLPEDILLAADELVQSQ